MYVPPVCVEQLQQQLWAGWLPGSFFITISAGFTGARESNLMKRVGGEEGRRTCVCARMCVCVHACALRRHVQATRYACASKQVIACALHNCKQTPGRTQTRAVDDASSMHPAQ